MPFSLGFGKGSSKTKSSFEQSQNTTSRQTETSKGSTVQTTLDPATISLLQGTIGKLGADFSSGSPDAAMIRELSAQLAANAAPQDVAQQIQVAQNEAQRVFRTNEAPAIANLEQQIGSTGNSFSQLIRQQGNVDLATSLAKVAGDVNFQNTALRSQNLSGAISGVQAASGVARSPLESLLAAITTLTGARTEQQTESESMADLIAQVLTKGSSVTKGSEKQFGFSLSKNN